MSKYALGLDFGTLDGRAILVDVKEVNILEGL